MRFSPSTSLIVLACAGLPVAASEPSPLSCDGFQSVSYIGQQVQDFVIPDLDRGLLALTASGADGGDAFAGPNLGCFGAGGQGASVQAQFTIGNLPGMLKPGGTLRFIVGQRGGGDPTPSSGRAAAGGGGGTGVAYLAPGRTGVSTTDWEVLIAAGAGGGGWAGFALGACTSPDRNDGLPGSLTSCGTHQGFNFVSASNAGCNGEAGNSAGFNDGGLIGGAGGGAIIDAVRGGQSGLPIGGTGQGLGGWGFGGGGGAGASAGGGGGYSGGAPGDILLPSQGSGGGGGGTYFNPSFANQGTGIIRAGSAVSADGYAGYQLQLAFGLLPNDDPAGAVTFGNFTPAVTDLVCGAEPSGIGFCGTTVTEGDVWYRYTNTAPCSADVTFRIDDPAGSIYTYDDNGMFDETACRSFSTGGSHVDRIPPGASVYVRVTTAKTTSITASASVSIISGPDCFNDTSDVEIPVEPGGVYPFQTDGLTREKIASCDRVTTDVDLWYRFTAPADGALFASLDFTTPIAQLSNSISIWDSLAINELACDRYVQGRLRFLTSYDAALPFPMTQGDSVLIRVGHRSLDPAGTLRIEFDPTLTNDRCASRTLLAPSVGDTLTVPFDMTLTELDESVQYDCPSGFNEASDIWYEIEVPAASRLTLPFIAGFELSRVDASDCNNPLLAECSPVGDGLSVLNTTDAPQRTVFRLAEQFGFLDGTLSPTVTEAFASAWATPTDQADFFDVLDYLSAFDAGTPTADYAAPYGTLNAADVLSFLMMLEAE
ncbi:MAG: hypothetical protein AAGG07_05850 [Planctomycetota bacterium]